MQRPGNPLTIHAILLTALAAISLAARPAEAQDAPASAQRDPGPEGLWVGKIASEDGSTARIITRIEHDDEDGWSVEFTHLFAGMIRTPCRDIVVDGRRVAFTTTGGLITIRIEGELDEAGEMLGGDAFRLESGDKRPRIGAAEFTRRPQAMEQPAPLAFSGELKAGAVRLDVTIVIATTPKGQWVGHMDVPAQNLREFPFLDMSRDDEGFITGTLPVPGGATLRAKIDEETHRLVGTFTQGGVAMPVNFAIDPNYEYRELARPQHPEPPYPYKAREVEAEHPAGSTLAGTLTIPDADEFGPGPFPTVVCISGSGQQDRDETILGHKPFLVIADALTRRGIAVMRYDDRGVGGSQVADLSLVQNATSEDFASDASTVIDAILDVGEVDGSRIGLLGHSEGGLIAPMVAQRRDDIAFLILLAAPGVRGDELLVEQTARMWKAVGADPAALPALREQFAAIIRDIAVGADSDAIREALVALTPAIAEAGLSDAGADEELGLDVGVEMLGSPWMRYFFRHDPAPGLAAFNGPILALNGTKDLQVWHEQNLDAIERIVAEAGGDVTIKRYEGLNHLFQPAGTGLPTEYATIETTIDEQVLEDIAAWILAQFGGKN